MTGVQWFNAATIAVIVAATVGLIRHQVAEWRAAKVAAPTSKVERRSGPDVCCRPPAHTQDRTNTMRRR